MNRRPPCLLLSHDADLIRRVGGFLSNRAAVRAVDSLEKLEGLLERTGATVVWFDLREGGMHDTLAELVKSWPETVFIALGQPGSEPMSQCEHLDIYAFEDLQANRSRLQMLFERAVDHLRLTQENQALRKRVDVTSTAAAPHRTDEGERPLLPVRRFPGARQHFDDMNAVLEGLVEDVAGSIHVARAGVFSRGRADRAYTLRAGVRCLEDTHTLEFDDRDPLVRWLTLNAHLVYRAHLDRIRDEKNRAMLDQTLEALGAEAMVPLQARERLLGWLFVGHRSTGLPFDEPQLENLALLAEHISTTLENFLLYEEVAVQKTLAETLLHSMPTGIVAIDGEGLIRWFNHAAEQLLGISADKVINQRIEILGSRLADVLRRGLSEESPEPPAEWTDSKTQRTLSIQTRRLARSSVCLGAVGLIQDITVEQMLEEKEDQLERAQFWTELAASMSHEVKNPLVAIRTFAQLLPERYEDSEFRNQFSRIVTDEVDRLNKIVDDINRFAHPRTLEFHPLDIRHPIQRSLDAALKGDARNGLWIDTAIDGKFPLVSGDEKALAECFGHILTNAMEALVRNPNPRIVLSAKEYRDGEIGSGVAISIRDNGRGISTDLKNKVFSPFCTTKARGMGLGLPIVKRTVIDHNGRISLESNEKGTCVTIILPAAKIQSSQPTDELHEADSREAPPKQNPLALEIPAGQPAHSLHERGRTTRLKTNKGSP